jgi:hypothetical protein
MALACLAVVATFTHVHGFLPPNSGFLPSQQRTSDDRRIIVNAFNQEWESDFDDFGDKRDDDVLKLSDVLRAKGAQDLSGCRTRQVIRSLFLSALEIRMRMTNKSHHAGLSWTHSYR